MDKATKGEFGKVHKSIAKIGKTMEKGFAAVMEDAAENKAELKGNIIALQIQTSNLEKEVRSIRRDLETLKDKVGNIEGYRKEIDHGLERIARIEKHLGISSSA